MGVQISPSILSADFADLAAELGRIEPAADWVHVDVMDNHFVPNLTLGLPVVERLAAGQPAAARRAPDDRGPRPLGAGVRRGRRAQRHLPRRGRAGAGAAGARRCARRAPAPGWRCGRRPPVEPYVDLLPELDMLLVMTVEPGFGGQTFLDVVLPKIRAAPRADRRAATSTLWLQVDGGVSADTIERCAEAGADVFVAGSAVYGADDPAAAVAALRAQAEQCRVRRRLVGRRPQPEAAAARGSGGAGRAGVSAARRPRRGSRSRQRPAGPSDSARHPFRIDGIRPVSGPANLGSGRDAPTPARRIRHRNRCGLSAQRSPATA